MTAFAVPRTIRDLIPLAQGLSRKLASPVEKDDLIQEALFAAHKAFKQIKQAEQPYALARTVMSRAMWRLYYTAGARETRTTMSLVDLSMDEHDEGPPEQLTDEKAVERVNGRLLFSDFFVALERQHGSDARAVAENLMAPNEQVSWTIVSEVVRKQAIQRSRRSTVRLRGIDKHARVSNRMIREGLGYSPVRWNRLLRLVRSFVIEWCADR